MNTESFSYEKGKPSFNGFLIGLLGPLYCSFSCIRMRLRVKEVRGSVPLKGGVLIAAHHEEEEDPFVVKKAVKRRLNWIAATMLFGKSILEYKFLKKIWDLFGIISIDPKKSERNRGLFDYITYLLEIGEAIVIFPEGKLRKERENQRLGKAKEGIIRIAQFAQKRLKKNIPIYPIGIEYKKMGEMKEAYVKIGLPIIVKNNAAPKKAMRLLMKKIGELSNAR